MYLAEPTGRSSKRGHPRPKTNQSQHEDPNNAAQVNTRSLLSKEARGEVDVQRHLLLRVTSQ